MITYGATTIPLSVRNLWNNIKTTMNPNLFLIFLILLVTPTDAKCRRRPFKLTEKFCGNVPTANVDLHAFAGTWFQIFVTSGADIFQINSCTTAQYLLQRDGTIKSLECEFADFLPRPRCLRNDVIKRPGGGPGSLIVFEDFGPVNLDIIALLGDKSYGYFAAVAFICLRTEPRTPGYFILARKPVFQRKTLRKLKKKLRCLGFPLPKPKDFKFTQVKRCKYFFGKEGFDIFTPPDIMIP